MEQIIDLQRHPFTVQCDSTHRTIGHFSTIDWAVRTARDYSIYQGTEFPQQERLTVHIFDRVMGHIFDQAFIDKRSEELLAQDLLFV